MKNNIFVTALLFSFFNCIAQKKFDELPILDSSVATFSGIVTYFDSAYYFKPLVILHNKNKLQVPRQLFFQDGTNLGVRNGEFFLSKIILNSSVNLSVDKGLRQHLIQTDLFHFVDFSDNNQLTPINLNDEYPLEKGLYYLSTQMMVRYKGKDFKIQVFNIEFIVLNIAPQNALYHP